MGGVVDAIGDVVGGAADVVGDVVGGVADIAGDVIETVADNPELAIIAGIFAAPYLAPELFYGAGIEAGGAGILGADIAAAGSIGYIPGAEAAALYSSTPSFGQYLFGSIPELSAAAIAEGAVPVATLVNFMAQKKQIKCVASKTPANTDQRIAFRWIAVFHSPLASAKGSITNAPTKFRQKIKVGIGMVLFAIIGPEEPIPITPRNRNGISRPVGNLVWS